ncbi:serine/threonine-protein kinase [Agromyces atrinae]|nr:serine/threonine-protein kinase [Agromyces atrinae]
MLDSSSTRSRGFGQRTGSRYELSEHVGSGGMADIYLARDREIGRSVAIKIFRLPETPHDEVRHEREIRLLGSLQHPGLVEVYDAGVFLDGDVSRRFVVMEYVDGGALSSRLEKRVALTRRQVADVGAQIADALAYIHARGIVHRDVKPDNVLLSDAASLGYTITAKLADFGIAHFVEAARFTDQNTILGTANYISPEQARGTDVGTASDVYSLGLVLLEAITGEREFTGTPVEAALARLSRSPDIPGDLPDDWHDLLTAMTEREPDDRPTAHDVAATMRDLIRSMIMDKRGRRRTRRALRASAPRAPRRRERAPRDGGDRAGLSAVGFWTIIATVSVGSIGLGVGLAAGMHVFG